MHSLFPWICTVVYFIWRNSPCMVRHCIDMIDVTVNIYYWLKKYIQTIGSINKIRCDWFRHENIRSVPARYYDPLKNTMAVVDCYWISPRHTGHIYKNYSVQKSPPPSKKPTPIWKKITPNMLICFWPAILENDRLWLGAKKDMGRIA